MSRNARPDRGTLLAQAGHFVDAETRALVPPIHSATTFARDDSYALGDYVYARNGVPGYAQLEGLIAELEGAADAQVFASGLAAATAVFERLQAGDGVVAPSVMYHGLQVWLKRLASQRGIKLTLFDATDPGALEAAVAPGETRIVWIEPLLNPTWDVIDIAAAARIAHAAGAVLAVDATVTPPVTTRPLELGADLVFHSATKYLNGHSDVLGGVLATKATDAPWEDIRTVRTLVGGTLGPFEAWLLLRGMRTLSIRWERASANALAIATAVRDHPAAVQVLYPGLGSHPGHDIVARQMTGGFGGMLSIRVAGGFDAARRVACATKIFHPATSLGGVESLIEHRIAVEPPDSLVPPDLLRISVGIEAEADLIGDLLQALDAA
ncbi:MAG: aminotransferase class V-fold PLP-dependent enzyme [Pseudomonadota bacterium]